MSHEESPPSGPRPTALGPTNTAIGVLGGTFDPVHHGHLRIALDACELLGLDHVRLVPLRQAVHRAQPAAPPELRLAMLKAATEDSDRLVVDDRELQRPGPSFTVDTLRSLHAEFAGTALCLLLGEDAFAGLPGWHEPDAILDLASIAVLQRPGHELPGDPALAALMQRRRVDHLTPGRNGEIVTCEVTQLEIASSDLRRRVAAGRSIDYLVPAAVARLVRQNELYR